MRLDRSVTVARKDLSEFGRNRYIMMTLVIMPLIVSVILPIMYVVPINELSKQSTAQLDLDFEIVGAFDNATITDAMLVNLRLDHVDMSNCVVRNCIVGNSTVSNCNFNESIISYSSVKDCMLVRCQLQELTFDIGNTVRDVEYIGGNEELENLKDIMFNVLLILLMIIPVTIPTVTASYSFVGEKVNRSLEPMLATPITDLELLIGKSGSIFLMSMAATWLSFVVAVAMVDVLTEPVLGYYPLPNGYWMTGILLLAPAMCMMSILTNVIISSRVNDVRVSQQVGSVLVLPVILFFIFSISGFLSAGVLPMVAFSLAMMMVDVGIALVSLRVFQREEILVRWK